MTGPDLHPLAVFHLRIKRRQLEQQLRELGQVPVPEESLTRVWERVRNAVAENQTQIRRQAVQP